MLDSLQQRLGSSGIIFSADSTVWQGEARSQTSDRQFRMLFEDDRRGIFSSASDDSVSGALNYKKELETSLDLIKDVILDYGPTLSTVKAEEMLLLSVRINSRSNEIPESVDLQIKKADLVRFKKGEISRDQALNRIEVKRLFKSK